jgi:DnaJ-class molecular chaperone
MRTAKEIADNLDAEDRLRKRGYTKERCRSCDGRGFYPPDQMVVWSECMSCRGKGYRWQGPLMC